MNTLSSQRPRPSIEILTPAARSLSVKTELVNCEPWSVLKISGRPNRPSASSRASRQKLVSIVLDKRHDNTARLAQSMIATRYRNPSPIGIYVMSAAQTWLGRSIVRATQQVGIDLVTWRRLRGGRLRPERLNPHQAHQ